MVPGQFALDKNDQLLTKSWWATPSVINKLVSQSSAESFNS
jgi:hypothetical protein